MIPIKDRELKRYHKAETESTAVFGVELPQKHCHSIQRYIHEVVRLVTQRVRRIAKDWSAKTGFYCCGLYEAGPGCSNVDGCRMARGLIALGFGVPCCDSGNRPGAQAIVSGCAPRKV